MPVLVGVLVMVLVVAVLPVIAEVPVADVEDAVSEAEARTGVSAEVEGTELVGLVVAEPVLGPELAGDVVAVPESGVAVV